MADAGIGRLLVASLHQSIVDVLPGRLDFYEVWLNPSQLRDGKIGLAPLAAVLSFLREEGEPYHAVAAKAGEYTAQWTLMDLSPWRRRLMSAAPRSLRMRLVMGVARRMVRRTYGGSRLIVKWRKGRGAVDIRGSLFCEVRARVPLPLCGFYVAAIGKLMRECDVDVDVVSDGCRATGAGPCLLSVTGRVAEHG